MKYIRLSLVALFITAVAYAGDFAGQYPGTWSDTPNAGIMRALASNNVAGCGQYSYKAAAGSSSEYLVYCTRDGKNWMAYLVWPKIGKVMGPNRTSPDIPPPK
ncbi:hypothetical protein MCEMSEM18_03523 [Comamonadaceae bacterium]